jgi:hypothetical protein
MTEPTPPTPIRRRRAGATSGMTVLDASVPSSAPDVVAAPPFEAAALATPDSPVSPPVPAVVALRSGEDIASVAVGSLRVERGGIGEATADSVEVRMGGIGKVDAEDVYVQWGGIGNGRATTMSVELGSVGLALAGELRVTQGMVSNVAAREATVEQSFVRTLIAQHVTFSRPSGVLVLIAGRVDGDVRPVLDWRGALAAGLAFGLVGALAKAVRRR